ncbi:oligosaccharide flippase family protein [Rhodococcus hoagii]|nr:oligosaccharide flippase family protein [Prescottella equi]
MTIGETPVRRDEPRGRMHSAIFGEKSRGILAYGLGPVLGLMSGPILAHAMGPVGRGQFAGVMQPITIAAAFASIGIPSAVAFFSASGTDVRACFRVGLRLCIIPATIVAAVMIWYAGIISERQGIGLAFVLSCWSAILLSAVVQIRRGSWQGVGRWRILDTERATGALLRFIFVVVVALLGATSAEYFVAAALASFAIAASLLFRRLPKTRFDSDVTTPPNRKAVAKYAIFASVGTIATIASSRLDQLLMPAASTSAELGYYAIAVTVAEIPLVLATLAARNALPSAARGAANSKIFRDAGLFFRSVRCLGYRNRRPCGAYNSDCVWCRFRPECGPHADPGYFQYPPLDFCILLVDSLGPGLSGCRICCFSYLARGYGGGLRSTMGPHR